MGFWKTIVNSIMGPRILGTRERLALREQLALLEWRAAVREPRDELVGYEQALARARGVGDRRQEQWSLSRLGLVCHKLGRLQEAQSHYEQALALAREVGDRVGEAGLLGHLGLVKNELDRPQDALWDLQEALTIERELGNRAEEGATLAHLGRVYSRLGEFHKACQQYEMACLVLERVGRGMLSHEEKSNFFAAALPAFRDHVHLLMGRHQVDEGAGHAARAFHVWERARGQGILGLVTPFVGERPVQPEALTVPQVQEQVLDESTALLEYTLGQDKSYVWAVTKNACETFALPPAVTIRSKVMDFFVEFIAKERIGDFATPAYELYRLLVQPAEGFINDNVIRSQVAPARLIVVPDYGLDFLPFELLLTGPAAGGLAPAYLLREFSILYTPSATVLAVIRQVAAERNTFQKEFIGFAPVRFRSAPPLPHTEQEIKGIARLFPRGEAEVRLKGRASKVAAQSPKLQQYRYVHFATHGYLYPWVSKLAGLWLAGANGDDSLLDVSEILLLDVTADLVTASACQSGLGEQTRADGVVGLARAFLAAGASSVCVSLWEVFDESTAHLMLKFYSHLAGMKLDKAESLRQAKLEMIGEGRWTHPFYWAPFTLVGDWRHK